MYCPECGHDAEDAKFCPECGADLRAAAAPACDECGGEIPDGAKFCPECGAPAGAAAEVAGAPAAAAAGGRRTGTRGRGAGASQRQPRQQQRRQARKHAAHTAPAAADAGKRLPAAVFWGGLGAVLVVAILVIVFVTTGGGGSDGSAAPTGTQSVQPVAADTSGSYGELVQRANGLYDQGAAAYDAQEYDQGAEYFAAAAKVYAAAWKQRGTDPGVGTDYATSLFYSGRIDPAIKQVELVLAQSPTFQTAWFNKGNYLAEKARQAEQDGSAEIAKAAYADARAAYEKAVELDAGSASGQQAQQRLDALPQ